MSIKSKYPNVSITFKKKDRGMIPVIIAISESKKWSIAQTLAWLIESGLKAEGALNDKKK